MNSPYKFTILAIIMVQLFTGCYDDSIYNSTNFEFDDLIEKIEVDKTTLLANNKDKVNVKVFFHSDSTTSNINFSAKINNGTFLETGNDSIFFDEIELQLINNSSSKIIEFNIISSNKPGEVELKLNLNNYIKFVYFEYEESKPDKIEISSSEIFFNRKNTKPIPLDIFLSKKIGEPSINQSINFRHIDSLENSIGEKISDCDFNESNKCQILYTIWPDTSYVGTITLIVEVDNSSPLISDSLTIYTTN